MNQDFIQRLHDEGYNLQDIIFILNHTSLYGEGIAKIMLSGQKNINIK